MNKPAGLSEKLRRRLRGEINQGDEAEALSFFEENCQDPKAWAWLSEKTTSVEKVKLSGCFILYKHSDPIDPPVKKDAPKYVDRDLASILNHLEKSINLLEKRRDWFPDLDMQIKTLEVESQILEAKIAVLDIRERMKKNKGQNKNKHLKMRNHLIRSVYQTMKVSRGDSFDITKDESRKLLSMFCLVCGAIDKSSNFPDENLKNILSDLL